MIKVNILDPIPLDVQVGDVQFVDRWAQDTYEGEYEVTPEVRDIVLETKNLVMKSDVTVLKIPRYDVSNASGTTIVIGGDI